MSPAEKNDKLNALLGQALILAKQFDELHQDAAGETGPFATIPDGYCTVPIIDDTKFTKEQIDQMSTAIMARAKKQDIGSAGMSFLKMFLFLLQSGIKIAGLGI